MENNQSYIKAENLLNEIKSNLRIQLLELKPKYISSAKFSKYAGFTWDFVGYFSRGRKACIIQLINMLDDDEHIFRDNFFNLIISNIDFQILVLNNRYLGKRENRPSAMRYESNRESYMHFYLSKNIQDILDIKNISIKKLELYLGIPYTQSYFIRLGRCDLDFALKILFTLSPDMQIKVQDMLIKNLTKKVEEYEKELLSGV